MSCVFCEIVAGRAEATIVYRDAVCAAFMDIQPVNPGHVLIVPVRHAADLQEIPSDEWEAVAALGRRVAAVLQSWDTACEGVNLLLADGAAAGQEVFHTHLHVIPRFAGDGFGFHFPKSYFDRPPREALESLGEELRAQIS